MSNAQIATLAVGLISITEGGTLWWSIIAIAAGILVGTLFMAFHSAQGPQLGLPQMIQSRPQFGYLGALLVWLFAYLQYAGFNVFNSILAADSLHLTVHGSTKLWIVVVTVVAFVIALFGYDLIHRAERVLTYLMLGSSGSSRSALFFLDYPPGTFALGSTSTRPRSSHSSVSSRATRSAGRSTSRTTRATCRRTSRSARPSTGRTGDPRSAALADDRRQRAGRVGAAKNFSGTAIPEINAAGDHVFTGFGAIVLILAALGLISVMALNMYGGSLTLISAIDSFSRIRPTLTLRVDHRRVHRGVVADRRAVRDRRTSSATSTTSCC